MMGILVVKGCNGRLKKKAATGGVLYEKILLKIWQNSQENTCASVSF